MSPPTQQAPPRRRVLVVAYYFPPMGMSGVQRIAKLVKYLPDSGWDPTVLTVEPGGYFAFDPDLLAEVEQAGVRIVRTGSLDPTRAFGRGKEVDPPTETRRRVLAGVSQALFIPDNKIGWYPAAVRRGRALLAAQRYDAVLSSAPPYTAHLVARNLAGAFDVPLITDFRDDWVGNPRHSYPTPVHRWIHGRLENRVLRASRLVTVINPVIRDALIGRNPDIDPEVFRIVPQGFDAADYALPAPYAPGPRAEAPFRLVYTGVFYDAQTPGPFLEGLARFVSSRPDARVQASFFGLFPAAERDRIERLGLSQIVRIGPYLGHREAMREVEGSDVAWLTIGRREGAEQISTGKLYAYMGAHKPILALVPDGAARMTLNGYGAAVFADPDQPAGIADAIGRLYDAWRSGSLPTADPTYVAAHDRKLLAARFANMLNDLLEA